MSCRRILRVRELASRAGMAGLLHDRYFEFAPDQAWDLMTGAPASPLVAQELEDASTSAPDALIELLEHGAEGAPRWIVADATAAEWVEKSRVAASEARRRGYVAIGLHVFLRARRLLSDDLRSRAIVLIAQPDTAIEQLRIALLHAAAISPRSHVLMSLSRQNSRRANSRWRAAEARAAYGPGRSAAVTRPALSLDVM